MDTSLNGRTALVTGSFRGTGAVIARRLAEEHARVILHEFEPGQADAVAAEIDNAIVVTGNLADADGTAALVADVRARAGAPAILVNNYGTAAGGTWQSATTTARLVQAFLPDMMAAGWGRIINLGTIGSSRPNARMPHYYAAKGALAAMTMSLVREVGANGITVNLVSPGLILTDEVRDHWLQRGRQNGWGERWEEIEPHVAAEVPLGRIARREEIADLVCFLASDRAAFIHGQNIAVDGGALGLVN